MAKIVVVGSFVVGLTIRVLRMPVIGEGFIGDDLLSKIAFDTFQKEGISIDHIHRIEGVNTAIGVVHLIPSGDNWIIGHLGANMHMGPHHVDAAEDLIAQSDIVMTQFEVPLEAVQGHRVKSGAPEVGMTQWASCRCRSAQHPLW